VGYLVWVRREDGDHYIGSYPSFVSAVCHCKYLARGYVTSSRSWGWLFSVGL
jgi:hypothetical protein